MPQRTGLRTSHCRHPAWERYRRRSRCRDEDGRRDLAAVQVPAFILHGAKDVVVSTALAEIQQRGIRGSKRITLENSGHGIVYNELERFNRLFLDALRS